MPRPPRVDEANVLYHVVNRSVGKKQIFFSDCDYETFERLLAETQKLIPMRICGYCIMPNHWHLVLWPERKGLLSKFMHRLTSTHTRRWQNDHECEGTGHLYQGRFRSIIVGQDEHSHNVLRYVEQNPLRANLVSRAEEWRWSSLWIRNRGNETQKKILCDLPIGLPTNWIEHVNKPLTDAEETVIRECSRQGRPYGNPEWVQNTISTFGLENTFHSIGRPKEMPIC